MRLPARRTISAPRVAYTGAARTQPRPDTASPVARSPHARAVSTAAPRETTAIENQTMTTARLDLVMAH